MLNRLSLVVAIAAKSLTVRQLIESRDLSSKRRETVWFISLVQTNKKQ